MPAGKCFNEAGAIEPRKPKQMIWLSPPNATGFNEAGAIEPRKPPRAASTP